MKKIVLTIALLLTVIVPFFGASAETKKYQTMNLDEVLTQEEIEHDFSKYKESDKQITIYLFRGYGCGYCHRFLEFLNSIIDDYGKYFKVVSYETWYDRDNYNLMTEVSNFLGQPAGGVPYIIIGDQVFAGYSNEFDDSIKEAIKKLYNQKDRYDVMVEMEKAKKAAEKANAPQNDTWLIIGIVGGAVVICSIVTICILMNSMNKQTRTILRRVYESELESKKVEPVKTIKNEAKEEVIVEKEEATPKVAPKKTTAKKTVKKVTKK